MSRLTAFFLIGLIVLSSSRLVPAQAQSDWSAVGNLVDQEIAVRTRGGKTLFGRLRAADDSGIQLQLADRRSLQSGQTAVGRGEIDRIWRANLRFGERQAGRGALIGAGAGAAVGTGIFLGTRSQDDDGLAGAVIPMAAILGAGIGTVAGIFAKKSHRKLNLVYRA
jgi:small nuclear ribonucleoprotein (snRNP)-like protein